MAQQKIAPSVNEALLSVEQGQVAQVPDLDIKDLSLIPYERKILPSPQFLLSDEPEYIRVEEGVALRERVEPGEVRLYVYNVNGVEEPRKMPRKISAVIENLGDAPLTLQFIRYSFQPPSENYYLIGKQGLADFLSSQPDLAPVVIPPGTGVPIDSAMDQSVALYNELVHGFYEFSINQPALISVVQTAPETPSVDASRSIEKVLPTRIEAGAGRGLFPVCNYEITPAESYLLDPVAGPAQLIVADGETDPWITGTDSTGAPAENRGNYGVLYNIRIPWRSTDGRGLALVTWNERYNPDQWCGAMAAAVEVSSGKFDGGVVLLPSDRLITRAFPEVVLIQVFPPPPPGVTETIQITYSPPGASCLPTPLLFIPVQLD